ncbi:DoxX family protein [Sneathiella sp.]|uniref:DoxX family protein n=1 Tax=Sneathiella sp. TaxID=1964365 RepID=UPI00356A1340
MNDRYHDMGYLIARIFLAAVFLYSGAIKATDWSGSLTEVTALALPLPELSLALTIIVQIAGGIALISGRYIILAAGALAVFTVFATLLAHDFWNYSELQQQRQLTTALEHLAIIGGFILIALSGPGRYRLGGKA